MFRGGKGEAHSHSSAVQITAIQCENGRSDNDDNNNNVIRGMPPCGDYRVATLHGTIINIHAVLKVKVVP